MKRNPYRFILLLLVILFLLSGCGKEEQYRLQAEYEALLFEDTEEIYKVLGQQYYGGKEIRLAGTRDGRVLLCEEGQKNTVFLQNVPTEYLSGEACWWLDDQGRVFVLVGDRVTLLDENGQKIKSVSAPGNVTDICQNNGGEVVVLVRDPVKYTSGLAVFCIEEEQIFDLVWMEETIYGIGTGQGQDVLVADERGICGYSLVDHNCEYYIEWRGTAYDNINGLQDIKFVSDQQMELFVSDDMLVTIKKVNTDQADRITLTYKTTAVSPQIKEMINRFNRENQVYYIMLEECPESMDFSAFRGKIQAEIATGHGPDILDAYSVPDIQSLIAKGALEDLATYQEQSGMDSENYFPVCFQTEGGLYLLPYGVTASGLYLDSQAAGAAVKGDIESLLDLLENYPEKRKFAAGMDAADLLDLMIMCSENAQGMVDEENGTCGFVGARWERMVNLAMQYGENEENRGTESLAVRAFFANFGAYASYDTVMEQRGMTFTGYPGETEDVILYSAVTLCMNGASENKEGVWQFLEFLLREDVQETMSRDGTTFFFPVHRGAFAAAGEWWTSQHGFQVISAGSDISAYEFTTEQLTEVQSLMEDASLNLMCPQTIRNVVREEMTAYFAGEKSMEDASVIVQNRVQLYLDETGK